MIRRCLCLLVFFFIVQAQAQRPSGEPDALTRLTNELAALDRSVQETEDLRAIKRLQRAYGYYLDRGLWEDLIDLFTEDAIGNYPAGIYVGKDSLYPHFLSNNGGGRLGYREGRLANHTVSQPVVTISPEGNYAYGRWRVIAMLSGSWAGGVYENEYIKQDGVWKIHRLHYYSDYGVSFARGYAREPQPAGAGTTGSAGSRFRNLPHPFDLPRNEACNGYPEACIIPFHYLNPGSGNPPVIRVPQKAAVEAPELKRELDELLTRAARLQDEADIENLTRIYGYYVDRALWDEVADLFADDGTFEHGQRGVYVGKDRVRQALDLFGPEGPQYGHLDEHIMYQPIAHVAPDGMTAKSRSRELTVSGDVGEGGTWSEGVYENTYIKDDGVWKIQSLQFYPTFIADYDEGWGVGNLPTPGVSSELPPDAPPTEDYDVFPAFYIPALHFNNPVSGEMPRYPEGFTPPPGRNTLFAAASPPVARASAPGISELEAAIAAAEVEVRRVTAYDAIENLGNAYGWYLDKFLWDDLADLFADEGSMELAQRGVYIGRERVRTFLKTAFGASGPSAGSIANHMQFQPVIHVAGDGLSGQYRIRLSMQMGSTGGRGSWGGGIYENEVAFEDGKWKLKTVHVFNTYGLSFTGAWDGEPRAGFLPGPNRVFPPDTPPSVVFEGFPHVWVPPFHYSHPVTGLPFESSVGPVSAATR